MVARAKRKRVVQDEVEKANRRPTDRHGRHDTTPLTPSLKFDKLIREIAAHSLFENEPLCTLLDLCVNHFRRKLRKLRRTPYLKTDHFSTKIVKFGEIEAHSVFEN